jgi:hypothetical protein
LYILLPQHEQAANRSAGRDRRRKKVIMFENIRPVAPAEFREPDTRERVIVTQSHRQDEKSSRTFWMKLSVSSGGDGMVELEVTANKSGERHISETDGYLTLTCEQAEELSRHLLAAVKETKEDQEKSAALNK